MAQAQEPQGRQKSVAEFRAQVVRSGDTAVAASAA